MARKTKSGKASPKTKKGSTKLKANQVLFSNGAIAEKGKNPKNPNLLTIVKGPTKGNTGPRGMKALDERGAARAFNKYYSTTNRYKSPKARQAAITRDLCHAKPADKTVRTNKYSSFNAEGTRRGPATFDYPGVDDGSLCPTGPAKESKAGTSEMKDKMAKVRAAKMSGGSPKKKASPKKASPKKAAVPKAPTPLALAAIRAKAEGKCFYNPTTSRCAKGPFPGQKSPQWCRLGKKGVCKKTSKGKKNAPVSEEAKQRGKELYAALVASKK